MCDEDENTSARGREIDRTMGQEWVPIKGGLKEYQPKLRHVAGLYRYTRNGEVVALGTGTDKSGGLAKRLSDFIRPGDSGRLHHAAQLIHQHRGELKVEVLIAGNDAKAREIAQQLKTPLIKRHRPKWTVLNAPFMRKS